MLVRSIIMGMIELNIDHLALDTGCTAAHALRAVWHNAQISQHAGIREAGGPGHISSVRAVARCEGGTRAAGKLPRRLRTLLWGFTKHNAQDVTWNATISVCGHLFIQARAQIGLPPPAINEHWNRQCARQCDSFGCVVTTHV
jgi:hypothetical protein